MQNIFEFYSKGQICKEFYLMSQHLSKRYAFIAESAVLSPHKMYRKYMLREEVLLEMLRLRICLKLSPYSATYFGLQEMSSSI